MDVDNVLKKDFYDSIMNEFRNINFNMNELPQEKKEPYNFYDIRDLFLIYVNWRKRFIGPGYRRVVYSKELQSKLSKNKKIKKIVNKLSYKLTNNEDLTPFLTKMIVNKPHVPSKSKDEFENLNEEQRADELRIKGDKDLLLNFFGVQHFHLESNYNNRTHNGVTFTVGENYKRGKELLYAKVDKDIVYFIDMNEHNLYDRNILRIIKNNWNHLLQPFESDLSYVSEYTDDETIELIKNGINPPCIIDDKTYIFPPISVAGTSNMEFFQTKDFFKKIQESYVDIMTLKKEIILNKIQSLNKNFVKNTHLEVHVVIKDGLLFFVDTISSTTIKFQDNDIYISAKYCEVGYHTNDFNS